MPTPHDARHVLVRQLYEGNAQEYHRRYAGALDAFFREMADEWVAERVAPLVRDGCLVDIGTGTGRIFDVLRPRRALAIDLSERMVRIARGRVGLPGRHFAVMDMTALGVRPAWADAVTAVGTFEAFREIVAPLREIRPILRPGGRLVLRVCNRRRWWRSLSLRRRASASAEFTVEQVEAMLAQAGFVLEQWKTSLYLPRGLFWKLYRVPWPPLRRLLLQVDRRLYALSRASRFLARRGGTLMVSARRA